MENKEFEKSIQIENPGFIKELLPLLASGAGETFGPAAIGVDINREQYDSIPQNSRNAAVVMVTEFLKNPPLGFIKIYTGRNVNYENENNNGYDIIRIDNPILIKKLLIELSVFCGTENGPLALRISITREHLSEIAIKNNVPKFLANPPEGFIKIYIGKYASFSDDYESADEISSIVGGCNNTLKQAKSILKNKK